MYSDEIEALYDLVAAQFNDNTTGEITPARARAVLGKLLEYVANLNTNQVKGALFRVPFIVFENGLATVPTLLIPVRSRILGMEAQATNGTDATTAGAGVQADPITFKLLAYSLGTIDALVDEQAATTTTIKARWVRTSGTDEEKVATFPVLPLEDVNVYRGEVYQHTFTDQVPAVTRLLEIRNDITIFSHPVPTGLDNDPYYKPFAPLSASSGYDDTAVREQLDTHTTDIAALENENTAQGQELQQHDDRLDVLDIAVLGAIGHFTTITAAGVVSSGYASLRNATNAMNAAGAGTVLMNYSHKENQGFIGGTTTVNLQGNRLDVTQFGAHMYGGAQLLDVAALVGDVVVRAGAEATPVYISGGGVILGRIDATSGDVANNATVILDGVRVYPRVSGSGGALPAATVVPVGANLNIVLRNGAAFVNCSAGPRTTVTTESPAAGGGAASTLLVLDTTDGLRVSPGIPVRAKFQVADEVLDVNVASLTYQLDTNTRMARLYGSPDRTKAQINALLAALTATQISEGTKLYVKTVPTVAANPATVNILLTDL